MDVTDYSRNMTNICQHHKYGYCKFTQVCRKYQIQEICLENNCEHENCPKRHPKNCRFFSLYQRCKFGEYCAFKHSENNEKKEIKDLKDKVKLLEDKDVDKDQEIKELNNRLEMLYATVEQIVTEREDLFKDALKAGETTPTVKGTKKRRKVKQHPTPSPNHQQRPVNQRSAHHHEDDVVTDNLNEDDGKVLTAEEIAQLYDDVEENPKEN